MTLDCKSLFSSELGFHLPGGRLFQEQIEKACQDHLLALGTFWLGIGQGGKLVRQNPHCNVAGKVDGIGRQRDLPTIAITPSQGKTLALGVLLQVGVSTSQGRGFADAYVRPALPAIQMYFLDLELVENNDRLGKPEQIGPIQTFTGGAESG